MKSLLIIFVSIIGLSSLSAFAQTYKEKTQDQTSQHNEQDGGGHESDDLHGREIHEMELGLESDGIVELAHVKAVKNVESSIFLLPGSIYLAGHTGDFTSMGYDRFSSFLLNIVNHHAQKMGAFQLESGVKLFGFEQQPFGAAPGSSLKFLRLNFTEIEILTVAEMGKDGSKRVDFKLKGKLGRSQQNMDLARLNVEQTKLLREYYNCDTCIVDAANANWGQHNSFSAELELKFNRFLFKAYAEINNDRSVVVINNRNQDTGDYLNYNMTEKKAGVEVELELLRIKNANTVNLFGSVEYFNLKQDYNYNGRASTNQNKFTSSGLLYKIGLKFNIGRLNKKKKKKDHH